MDALKKIIPAIRRRGRKVEIVLRADSGFAHLMLSQLQAFALRGTRLEKATIGTLRLRLFKIAARVKVSVRRIRFELAEGCPEQDVFEQVFKNLQAWPSWSSRPLRNSLKRKSRTPPEGLIVSAD